MIKHMTKLTGWTASLVALAATASADVKVNDYLSLNGYAAAAATYAQPDSGKSSSTTFNSGNPELDVVKVAAVGKYGDFGGKLSLLYVPTTSTTNHSDAGILDAYATYTKDQFTVTGGKFLSYLGYEAFDTSNMTQLTYGSTFFCIPAYHTGGKVDYAAKTWGAGVAVVDSVYNPGSSGWAPYASGDGEFGQTGSEAYVTYTGIDKLTLWAGMAYDDQAVVVSGHEAGPVTFDTWASYALNDKTTLAVEFDTQESVGKGYLAEVQYAFSDKLSGIVRASAEDTSHGTGDTGGYYTVAPTYKITPALSVRGEVSYADASEGTAGAVVKSKGYFYGIQALFVF